MPAVILHGADVFEAAVDLADVGLDLVASVGLQDDEGRPHPPVSHSGYGAPPHLETQDIVKMHGTATNEASVDNTVCAFTCFEHSTFSLLIHKGVGKVTPEAAEEEMFRLLIPFSCQALQTLDSISHDGTDGMFSWSESNSLQPLQLLREPVMLVVVK